MATVLRLPNPKNMFMETEDKTREFNDLKQFLQENIRKKVTKECDTAESYVDGKLNVVVYVPNKYIDKCKMEIDKLMEQKQDSTTIPVVVQAIPVLKPNIATWVSGWKLFE